MQHQLKQGVAREIIPCHALLFLWWLFSEGEGAAEHEADALCAHAVEDVVTAVQQVVGIEPQGNGAVYAVIGPGVQVDDVVHLEEVIVLGNDDIAIVVRLITEQCQTASTVLETDIEGQGAPGVHLDIDVGDGRGSVHAKLVVVIMLVVAVDLIVVGSIFQVSGQLDE